MNCYKCGKEMENSNGKGYIFRGIDVNVTIEDNMKTPEQIEYNNLQLGKYSNGNGECHVAICYECYIDGLFQL